MLRQLAEQSRDPRLPAIARRLEAPIRVAVRGRVGVGRRTVTAALAAAGVTVTRDAADVDVVVTVEALKPEDRSMIARSDRPTVVVLNKADLTGFAAGGPLTSARRRAAQIRALTGAPTVPMVAVLAGAALNDELLGALRTLVGHPADLTSTDAFSRGPHPLSPDMRRRLLDTLDRFGVAHAVVALGSGEAPDAVTALLHRLSGVGEVVALIEASGAPLRYRRLRAAVAELHAMAAASGDDRLTGVLSADDTVLAVMTAAVGVVEAAGVRVDRGDDRAAHLRRAVHWRRYGRGPVDALHRACAADICRGSLRLLGRSG